MLGSRLRGSGFVPQEGDCVVSLSKNINPSLVLVQPRKTRPFITERLLMGCKESNQTNTLLTKGLTLQVSSILSLFCNKFNKFIEKGAGMLGSIRFIRQQNN